MKFHASVAQGLKLKVRYLLGLIVTFAEVIAEKAHLNRVKLYQNTTSFKDIFQKSFWTLEAAFQS